MQYPNLRIDWSIDRKITNKHLCCSLNGRQTICCVFRIVLMLNWLDEWRKKATTRDRYEIGQCWWTDEKHALTIFSVGSCVDNYGDDGHCQFFFLFLGLSQLIDWTFFSFSLSPSFRANILMKENCWRNRHLANQTEVRRLSLSSHRSALLAKWTRDNFISICWLIAPIRIVKRKSNTIPMFSTIKQ